MIDGELFALQEEAKKKQGYLELTQDDLINLVFCSLSFDSDRITKDDVTNVLQGLAIDTVKTQIILNQKDALLRSVQLAKDNITLDETQLKDLHQILMRGFSDIGGLYRNVDISLSYSSHTPPSYIKVYDRMKKYFDFTITEPTEDIFEYIAYCHLQLAKIHPFLDGNGRLARLVLNYHLIKKGFLPITISKENRNEYFDHLEEFKVNKNILPFVEYLKKLEINSLNKFLKA